MATLMHSESRRLYSWWWDSHISPKNSRWLQENLTDMDTNVKAMIKLIEEDADSFARRAEMYYKKRPELMKLVEEFYRAYRALAERYDHATGALHQAHRTMAEAFPNQIPMVLSEDSPLSSYPTDVGPHTPEMPPPFRALFDPDDSQKDGLGISSPFPAIKRNGAYSEENDALMGRRGLKQLNEMFETGEGAGNAKLFEGKARKGLKFLEEEGKGTEYRRQNDDRKSEVAGQEDTCSEVKSLEAKVAEILIENQNLKSQIKQEIHGADKAKSEVQSVQDNLESEKEAALLQHQQSLEKISKLELELAHTQDDSKKLKDEVKAGAEKLNAAEERCLLLEKSNQALQLDLNTLEQKARLRQEELGQKQEEFDKLKISMEDERQKRMQAEAALIATEKLLLQSQEEMKLLAVDVHIGTERLKNMEVANVNLEEEILHLKEQNASLNEQSLSFSLRVKSLQEEIIFFKETKEKLEEEVILHADNRKILQRDLNHLKEEKNELELRHQGLVDQIAAVSLYAESLEAFVKKLEEGNEELRVISKSHEDEKMMHLESLKKTEKTMEKNMVLENSLSDAQAELERFRVKLKSLEHSWESLLGQISIHVSEKAALVSLAETSAQDVKNISEKNTLLEKSLSEANAEMEGLRAKLEASNQFCQNLLDLNSRLVAEKDTLASQVESISQAVKSLEIKCFELENKYLKLEREKDLMGSQLMELQDCFQKEKHKHEDHILTSKSHMTNLANQICHLQEETRFREIRFEMEQYEVFNSKIENYIMRRFMHDMEEKSLILSVECQRHQEESRSAERVISQLRQVHIIHDEKINLLSEHNENLSESIYQILEILGINRELDSFDEIKEAHFQLIMSEIRNLLVSISEANNKNCQLHLEISVLITLLKHLGMDLASLRAEKDLLKQETEFRTKELSIVHCEKHELLEMNAQLRQDLSAVNQMKEELEAEMQTLSGQISDLNEAHQTLQSKFCNLNVEYELLSKNHHDLKKKKEYLEEENDVILAEAMILECLNVTYSSLSAERALQLNLLSDDLKNLHAANSDLNWQIRALNEKMEALERENIHLKESVVCLEECRSEFLVLQGNLKISRTRCEHFNLELESERNLIKQKDFDILEANQNLLDVCQERGALEDEYSTVIGEAMMLEHLYFVYRNITDERAMQLKLLGTELDCHHMVRKDLDEDMKLLKGKLEVLAKENMQLKGSVICLEDCKAKMMILEEDLNAARHVCNQLNLQIESGNELLVQKDMELSQARWTLQEARQVSQNEISNLFEKVESLSQKLDELRLKQDAVEEENMLLLAEVMTMESLHLFFSELSHERALELKLFSSDLEHLHAAKQDLVQEIRVMSEKLEIIEVENMHLKDDLQSAKDVTGQSIHQVEHEKHLVLQKDMELLDSNQKIYSLQSQNEELRRYLDDLEVNIQGANLVREELESKISFMDKEITCLHEANHSLEGKLHNLQKEMEVLRKTERLLTSDLEKGMGEVMKKEFLHFIFMGLSTERASELKLLSNDLECLQAIKDELDQQIQVMGKKMEELKVENTHLKDILKSAENASEQLGTQILDEKNMLIQKEMELLEANRKLHLMQVKNKELENNLEGLKMEIDEAEMVREDLQKTITSLSDDNAYRDKEIKCACEAMESLELELSKLHTEIEELRSRERIMALELEKGKNDHDHCEVEIAKLLNDLQISSVNEAVVEEKLLKLILSCESLEIQSMINGDMLKKEFCSRNAYVTELKTRLNYLESENGELKADLNAYIPLLLSLRRSITSLEEHTLSLANSEASANQVNLLASHLQDDSSRELEGILELKKVIAKLEALQKVVLSLKLRNNDAAILKPKQGQVVKDIELDQVSSSSLHGTYRSFIDQGGIEKAESEDQMLKLWEAAERDYNNEITKAPSSEAMEHETQYHEIEPMEEEKSEYPSSELVAEKELGVDKLEVPKKDEQTLEEWKVRVIKMLASDAQRLSVLQRGILDLKKQLEHSETGKRRVSAKYDIIRAQLKEAEGAVLQMREINSKLTKKARDFNISSDNVAGDNDEIRNARRRQISERARRGSEKIGGIELELQKIQYAFLKLEEELEIGIRAAERKSTVLLKEYLHGEGDKIKKKKKRHLCGCMRPKTDS